MVLSKKKGIRVAQRVSVKQIFGKVEMELRKEDRSIRERLVVVVLYIAEEKEVLSEMDKEILEETSEEWMEEEIYYADWYVILYISIGHRIRLYTGRANYT